jgi:hypothetical protein
MPGTYLFERRYGKGALAHLRSMLDDPTVTYERIAKNLGLTKQRIGQLAKDFGVDGRQRERERIVRRDPRVIKLAYPPGVRSVVNKIRRSGQVTPYVFPPQPRAARTATRSQVMVLVNGRLCVVQFRKGRKLRPNSRDYARFDTTFRAKKAEFALWAMRSGRLLRVYVIPLTHLRNVSSVYLPVDGRYAVDSSRKPRKDWTRYEGAWHLLDSSKRVAL